MFIKQVIIQGFRSYRDQTVIDPFSPRHNVIIGRNGSGKSNFFFAIQFVLSDEFNNLGQEQRQQLLHEGSGPRVVSAFVEIIFDNSDGRIPVEKDEVSIRRVVGAKKDSYYMDKKHVTKSDVMNLLESAGFSRSNPYYIVKQGKINQLALAPDPQRLKLLREVAGTRVYDERKEESKTILKETENKKEKANEMITTMTERLSTLKEEKEELSKYQELDKMRRSLEYTIHDKELRDTREKLEKLEEARDGSKEGSKLKQNKMEEARAALQLLDQKLKTSRADAERLQSEKRHLEDDGQENIKQRAQLEFQVKDLEGNVEDDRSTKESSRSELGLLEGEIAEKQSELESIKPQFQEQVQQEEEHNQRLRATKERKSELLGKQGRAQQFESARERDTYLKQNIKNTKASLEDKSQLVHKREAEVEALKVKVQQQQQEIKDRGENLDVRRRDLERIRKDKNDFKLKIDDLQNERNHLWRRQNGVDMSVHALSDEMGRCERELRGRIPRGLSQAMDIVKEVVKTNNISGYYGVVIDTFHCEPQMYTAVDTVAGNRLFHHVVDNDRTATLILSHVNRQKKKGDYNFFPLDKLRTSEPRYPQSQEALPMISKLTFDPKFRPAMMTLFGHTLVCRDFEKASEFAQSARMDCITMEGDVVSRKGTMTGGYYDSSKCKLQLYQHVCDQSVKLEEAKQDRVTIVQEIEGVDGRVTQSIGEMQKLEGRESQLRENLEQQKRDIKSLQDELNAHKRALEPQERSLSGLKVDQRTVQKALEGMQAELGTELHSQLEPHEQQELEDLLPELKSLEHRVAACMTKRAELQKEMERLQSTLSDNLLRRKEELKYQLESVALSDNRQQLELKATEFRHLEAKIESNRERINVINKDLQSCNKVVESVEKEMDEWKTVERVNQESILEEAKAMEKLASKRSLLAKKRDESMRHIRELGSLPSDAFIKYNGLPQSQLWKNLQKCNAELKNYSHVNKKALDQFVNFTERKDKLMSRRDQLGKEYEAIVELMEVLEQRKHEAIQFTFKQVSRNFSDVFQELVPNGQGSLLMKRTVDAKGCYSVKLSERSFPESLYPRNIPAIR
ncbi:structural maintenance of chromosomes protein 3-like isoform X2 [Halichondria panicea]|uniref:structural maintenance of chromosomes protein 3-like isoform X2 n=1 Tax=Halichondria panicea TaxID=6063 RepID=UPI00312B2F4D